LFVTDHFRYFVNFLDLVGCSIQYHQMTFYRDLMQVSSIGQECIIKALSIAIAELVTRQVL
jgi:hypothetical protein